MGLLGKLLKTAIDVATLPIDITKDVVTMGGALTDKDKPYTFEKAEDIKDGLSKVVNEIEKL
jgi:hypothetical protein